MPPDSPTADLGRVPLIVLEAQLASLRDVVAGFAEDES